MTIRVLLADDQALIRAGFRVLIDAAEDLEVVGEAVDGEEAVKLTRERRADVVLMDIRMPKLDGVAATRRIWASPRSVEASPMRSGDARDTTEVRPRVP